jgi:hypothetical protein
MSEEQIVECLLESEDDDWYSLEELMEMIVGSDY